MPNPVQAAAEGMPEINRRRLLLGLASASTAAAVGAMPAPALASPAIAENPRLLELASKLPALVSAHNEAQQAQDAVEAKWNAVWPWAPDELTALGTAHPWEGKQPGEPEMRVMGGYLWRKGDAFPRRIVVTTRKLWGEFNLVRYHLGVLRKGKQKKSGGKTEAAWRDELARLERQHGIAETYEKECARLKGPATAEYETKWTVTHRFRDEMEDLIAAMMNEPDLTMEGLLIKAQALAAWDKSGKGMAKLAIRHAIQWHGQIAASILRHAEGGASS